MEVRKEMYREQDLLAALEEIKYILHDRGVGSCLIVLTTSDSWVGGIGGNVLSIAHALIDGRNQNFEGQEDLCRLIDILTF